MQPQRNGALSRELRIHLSSDFAVAAKVRSDGPHRSIAEVRRTAAKGRKRQHWDLYRRSQIGFKQSFSALLAYLRLGHKRIRSDAQQYPSIQHSLMIADLRSASLRHARDWLCEPVD